MEKIKKLNESERKQILEKSAAILPDNPSSKNFSPSQIKKRLYEGLLVLFEYLNKTIDNINSDIVDTTNAFNEEWFSDDGKIAQKTDKIDFSNSNLDINTITFENCQSLSENTIYRAKDNGLNCLFVKRALSNSGYELDVIFSSGSLINKSIIISPNNSKVVKSFSDEQLFEQPKSIDLSNYISTLSNKIFSSEAKIDNIYRHTFTNSDGDNEIVYIMPTKLVESVDEKQIFYFVSCDENVEFYKAVQANNLISVSKIDSFVDLINTEKITRQSQINNLSNKIDEIMSSSNVFDIVEDETNILNKQYWLDKGITDNDIVIVLVDSRYTNDTTYNRWNEDSQSFTKFAQLPSSFAKVVNNQTATSTKELVLLARQNTKFNNNSIYIGNSLTDGQVFIFTNQDKTKFVIIDADGYIQYATIEPPYNLDNVVIGDRYLEADNEIVKGLTDARMGIVSQYQAQPSNVQVGSSIFVDAKLRESINLYDNNNPSWNWSLAKGSNNEATFEKTDTGYKINATTKTANSSLWILNGENTLDKYGLKAGETFTISANIKISDSTKQGQITIYFYAEDGSTNRFNGFSPIGGGITTITTVVPSKAVKMQLYLMTYFQDSIDSPTIFEFSNIQFQKGNVATDYEPYGSYSKGKVMQYASKNLLNIVGMQEFLAKSELGTFNSLTRYTNDDVANKSRLTFTKGYWAFYNGPYGSPQPFANNELVFKQNNRYLFLFKFNSIIKARQEYIQLAIREQTDSNITTEGNVYYVDSDNRVVAYIFDATREINAKSFTLCADGYSESTCEYPYVLKEENSAIDTYDEPSGVVILNLTTLGDKDLLAEEAYEKYYSLYDELVAGNNAASNVYASDLIKIFGQSLFLTKPSGYNLTIYEFSENPPYLNQDVDISNFTLLNATTYTSSSAITLNSLTNSILIYISKSDNATISPSDLISWDSNSQLEYGNSATAHENYIAPILLGTFDRQVDGEQKTFSFVVLDTENQNLGFIADDGYITIDLAENVEDLTKSTFAYFATDLATEVAQLKTKVSDLETELSATNVIVEENKANIDDLKSTKEAGNQDANDIKTNGNYYIDNMSNLSHGISSLINPSNSSGFLEVISSTNSAKVLQKISCNSALFERQFDGSTWSDWKFVGGEKPEFDYTLTAGTTYQNISDRIVNVNLNATTSQSLRFKNVKDCVFNINTENYNPPIEFVGQAIQIFFFDKNYTGTPTPINQAEGTASAQGNTKLRFTITGAYIGGVPGQHVLEISPYIYGFTITKESGEIVINTWYQIYNEEDCNRTDLNIKVRYNLRITFTGYSPKVEYIPYFIETTEAN